MFVDLAAMGWLETAGGDGMRTAKTIIVLIGGGPLLGVLKCNSTNNRHDGSQAERSVLSLFCQIDEVMRLGTPLRGH